MSAQAIPAVFYRAASRRSPCDKWGFRVTLALVLAGLPGLVLGVDVACYLLLATAFVAILFGLLNPGVGLIGVSVLVTVETVLGVAAFNGPLPFNTLNYWLVIFIIINAKLVFHLRQAPAQLHLLLVAVLAAGLLWSTNPYPSGVTTVLAASAGFSLVLYFETLPAAQRRMLYWVAVSCSAVAIVFAVLQYQEVGLTSRGFEARFNPNGMGTVQVNALFAISLAVFAKVATRREINLLMLLGAANLAFAFLSASRGAISTALFAWLVTLVWGFSPSRKLAYASASVVVLLGLVSLFPQFREYAVHRVTMTFDSDRTVGNRTSGRWDLALVGWQFFLREPVAGLGTGGYRDAMTTFYDPDVIFWGYDKPAHSAWVQVLAENGLIGIVVLLLYVASFAKTGFLRRRHPGLLAVGLLASGAIALRFIAINFGSLGVWWLAAGSIYLLYKPRPISEHVVYALGQRQTLERESSGVPVLPGALR